VEWPEWIAGLQTGSPASDLYSPGWGTGCHTGVHARIGSGIITKSHNLATRSLTACLCTIFRAPSFRFFLANGWESTNSKHEIVRSQTQCPFSKVRFIMAVILSERSESKDLR